MSGHGDRLYRKRISAQDLITFSVMIKETDLFVSSDRDLHAETSDLVFDFRYQIENFIKSHPEFLTTLESYPIAPYAPPIVRDMIMSTRDIGVGPMAAVAGAIAQYVGLGLLQKTDQVIVENGGDVFLKINRKATVSIFAGNSPLSDRIGIAIPQAQMPVGICSSSGRVGHSLSFGSVDVITVLSHSAIRADGAATSIGNRIREKKDLGRVAGWAAGIDGIFGCLAIMGDSMATWGDIELVDL